MLHSKASTGLFSDFQYQSLFLALFRLDNPKILEAGHVCVLGSRFEVLLGTAL